MTQVIDIGSIVESGLPHQSRSLVIDKVDAATGVEFVNIVDEDGTTVWVDGEKLRQVIEETSSFSETRSGS